MKIEYNCIDNENLKDNETARRLRHILLKWIPFADTTYSDWDMKKDAGHFFGGSYFYAIETATPMFIYALLSSIGEYDLARAGMSADEMREKAAKALRYLCYTNEYGPGGLFREKSSNVYANGTKWGAKGEDFFRATAIGRTVVLMAATAVILKDMLDDEIFGIVEKIVTGYSDKWSGETPRAGTYFDTQCEENAWTALGISAGLVLYKRHPDREKWLDGFNRWAINSISTYRDRMDTGEYMGKSLRNYWMKGVTFHPDHTTENHSFVHPEYMAAGIVLKAEAAAMLLLTGNEIPDTVFRKNEEVYDSTIGKWCQDDGLIIPVQGQDWWYTRYHGNHVLHSAMSLLHKNQNSALYLNRCIDMMEKLQASHKTGTLLEENPDQTIDEHGHYRLRDMEHASALGLSCSLLLHSYLGEQEPARDLQAVNTELEGVYEYPFGCVVVNRKQDSFSAFSWRNKVMAFNLPKNGMWTVTPIVAGMTGEVRFSERREPDSLCNERDIRDSVKRHIDVGKEGFCATARVHRDGGKLVQDISFVSLPDGTTVYCDRFTAGEDCGTTTFHGGLIGVRNENIGEFKNLAKGYRDIHTGADVRRFNGYFGGDSDDVEYLPMTGILNIDDEMGFVYFNSNGVKYVNRHFYKAWKGVEDQLVFNDIKNGEFKKGDETPIFTLAAYPNCSIGETQDIRDASVLYEAGIKGTSAIETRGRLVAANFNDRDVNAVFTCRQKGEILIFPGETLIEGSSISRKFSISGFRSTWLEPVTRMKVGENDNMRILAVDGTVVKEDISTGTMKRLL